MKNILKPFLLLSFIFGLSWALIATPAEARSHKHHHHIYHSSRYHISRHHSSSHYSASSPLKTAQRHLINLGYLTGRADGVLGARTRKALINFQRDHGITASGKLTTPTYNALVELDTGFIGNHVAPLASAKAPNFYATHPDFYGHYNQQYENPMMLAPQVASNGTVGSQTIYSRFIKIDVSENGNDSYKTYTVTLNGQPLLQSVGQPAVIGISRTFELIDEDAIIFTTYIPNDPVCSYKHYLFTARSNGQNLSEINNCTRGYQGTITNNSLFIVFPEADAERGVASTWRYENGDLERL